MFVQSLRLPALTQSSNSGFFFEAGWFVLFFLPRSCNKTNQTWLFRELHFILKASPGSSSVATLLRGDQCYFLLTVRPYRGMLKYLSQFSQPITEGRFTKRPEKIWNRTEEIDESQTLFTANNTIPAQMLQLSAEVHWDSWTYYCCHACTHRHGLEPCSTPRQLAQQHTRVLQLNCLQRGQKGFLHPHRG